MLGSRLSAPLVLALLSLVSFQLPGAQAQSSSSGIVGAAGGAALPRQRARITGAENLDLMRHRSATGRVCLNVSGFVRPFATNKNLYDHVIVAWNKCPEVIKMKVCYYHSQNCVNMTVPSLSHKEIVLGTMPSTPDFRYVFREQFRRIR